MPIFKATDNAGQRPDVSIVLINWRMGHDLRGLLPCLEKHECKVTFETILINKPSEDGAEEFVRDSHSWVHLVSFDTFGIAIMRNEGLARAQGKYILVLDADTELLPGCLDELVKFMDAHPKVGGCGGHTTRLDGEFEYNVKRFYDLPTVLVRRSPLQKRWPDNPWTRRHLMKDKDHTKPFYGDWMAGACFCIRRTTLDQVGYFDASYYFGFEDVDWCWRAQHAGWLIAFNPNARIIHKVQRLSDKGLNKLAIEHIKSGLRFWWKTRHHGMKLAWPSRPLPGRQKNGVQLPDSEPGKATDLTIIIVNYNASNLLRDCLDSLKESAPKHIQQIIVVDNDSHDDSVEMVKREFPEVHLIANKENAGFTKANNQGIRIAKGRHVVLLNNDTRVHKGAFSKAIEYMDANPRIGAAGLKLLNADGSHQLSCRRFPSFGQALFNRHSLLTRLFPNNRFSRAYLMTDIKKNVVQDVDWVSGACLWVRREALENVGLLDERFFMYSEDVDFCYRVWEAGWRVAYLPFAGVVHLIGQSSKKNKARTIIERHRSMYRFYRKHYSRDLMFLDLMTAIMVGARCGFHLLLDRAQGLLSGGRA